MTMQLEAAYASLRSALGFHGEDVSYWMSFTWEQLPAVADLGSRTDFLWQATVAYSDPSWSLEEYRRGRRWIAELRESL